MDNTQKKLQANCGGLRNKGLNKTSMSDKPLLSIVTVVYNGEEYIKETIDSVRNIDYDNVEYIVVDGGSTDSTVDILRQQEEFIDFWLSENDSGIYDAMNKGWNLCSDNSHVLFLGAGDTLLKFSGVEFAKNANQNTIFFGDVFKDEHLFSGNLKYGLKLGNTIHHQALLVPKDNHTSPFNLEYRTYADFDFNIRLFKMKYQFVSAPWLRGYALPGGVSEKLNIPEMVKIVKSQYGPFCGYLCFLYCHYQRMRHGV